MQRVDAVCLPRIRVAVAVIVHNGRVLIGRRPPGVRLAGFWEFPGGKLEPGEAPARCAVREVSEECGLDVAIARQLPAILREDPDLIVELLPFFCELARPTSPAEGAGADLPTLQAAGTTQLQWVPISRLREFRFPPANDELLAQIERLFGATNDIGGP